MKSYWNTATCIHSRPALLGAALTLRKDGPGSLEQLLSAPVVKSFWRGRGGAGGAAAGAGAPPAPAAARAGVVGAIRRSVGGGAARAGLDRQGRFGPSLSSGPPRRAPQRIPRRSGADWPSSPDCYLPGKTEARGAATAPTRPSGRTEGSPGSVRKTPRAPVLAPTA